jgi:hypothetical protein
MRARRAARRRMRVRRTRAVAVEAAVRDRAQRAGRVERDDDRVLQTVDRVELLRDVLAIQASGAKIALEDAVQRNVVVARNDDERQAPAAAQEVARLLVFDALRALREVTARDDDIGIQLMRRAHHGFAHVRHVRRAEMQIGDVQHGQHQRPLRAGSAPPGRRGRRTRPGNGRSARAVTSSGARALRARSGTVRRARSWPHCQWRAGRGREQLLRAERSGQRIAQCAARGDTAAEHDARRSPSRAPPASPSRRARRRPRPGTTRRHRRGARRARLSPRARARA